MNCALLAGLPSIRMPLPTIEGNVKVNVSKPIPLAPAYAGVTVTFGTVTQTAP